MKQIVFLISFFIASISLSGQESAPENSSAVRFRGSVIGGLTYKDFYVKKLIEPLTYPSTDENYRLNGFTRVPTFGYQLGVLFRITFFSHFCLTSGGLYTMRKDTYKGNRYKIQLYGNPAAFHKIVKYEYWNHDLEIPVLAGYIIKKVTFSAGITIPVVIYSTAKYTYIPESSTDLTDKKISNYIKPTGVYPTLQASYDIDIKRFILSPFLAIELGKMNSFFFLGGVIYSIKF